ncbi:F-box protein At3g07870-like [Papaver somniferum]|uniref:F-box protein At3g07870-like n=1 Tax=Papaver somniferum TaxID=3469 RepID=UPI000E702015|nr:F-box protein At3g07870-like [Papaver somniferum]
MENLPQEIISEILSRLPIETILQCKHVCKTWEKLLDHVKVGTIYARGSEDHKKCSRVRFFYTEKAYDEIDLDGEVDVNKHYPWYVVSKYNRFCLTLTSLFINDILIGSCNGLICLATVLLFMHEPIFIFNPFIPNELIVLPPIRISDLDFDPLVVSGFGYARSTDEYKVIRIYYPNYFWQSPCVGRVEVYTIGSGYGWRNKGETSYCFCNSPGVLVDGNLHWLDYKQWKVVAFDLVTEEFRVLPSPPCFFWLTVVTKVINLIHSPNPFRFLEDNFQLHVLGGFLCVIYNNNGDRLDIWVLKTDEKEHKFEWVWKKEFSVECLEKDHTYEPFSITRNNKLLLWYDKYILLCYHPKIAAFSKLSDYEHVNEDVKYYQAIPHMKTSVSVLALEGKVQEISASQSEKERNNLFAEDVDYTELGRITWLEPEDKSFLYNFV